MSESEVAVRSAATGGVVERVVERIRAVALVAAIGYVLLSVVTVTVGLALTKLTSRTWPVNLDFDAVRWLAHHRTSTFDTLSLIGSWLAGQWTVPLTVAVLLAVFALVRHWEWFTLFAVGPALEGLVYLTTTWVVSRERPPVPRLEDLIHNDSFYSGHTASAVVLWGSIAIVVCAVAHSRWIRVLAVSWAFVVPVLVASSRAYRGMHFPSDTIVGALVGLGCLTTAVAASRVAVGEPLPSRLGARFPS